VVTAGGIDRTSDEPYEKTQMSKKFKIHAGFNSKTMANDIAVIQMLKKFLMSKFQNKSHHISKFTFVFLFSDRYINVIRLPRQRDATKSFAGRNVVASGYGRTSNRI